ncbi:MAG: hypothetical protein U0441_38070 [Polyangiaceae bacterium]
MTSGAAKKAPAPKTRTVRGKAAPAPLSRDELAAAAKEAARAIPGVRPADLKKKLPKPLQSQHEEVLATLRELAAAGELHRFVTAKAERFFAADPIETLVRVVPEVLAKTGPLALPDLKKAVIAAAPGHEDPLSEWLKIAPKRGLLFEHSAPPAKGKKGKGPKRFGATPDLEGLLAKALAELEKALDVTDGAGVPRAQILDFLAAKMGVSPTSARFAPSATRHSGAPLQPSDRDVVREALAKLASEDRPGALLLIEDLRRRTSLEKDRFDAAVLEMSRGGLAVLHHHDHPAGLSDEERNALVPDGRGVYYHGIAPRSPA